MRSGRLSFHRLRKGCILLFCAGLLAAAQGCAVKPIELPDTMPTTMTQAPATTTPEYTVPSEPVTDLGGAAWTLRTPWAHILLPEPDGTAETEALYAIYDDVNHLYHTEIRIEPCAGLTAYIPAFLSNSFYADVIGTVPNDLPALTSIQGIHAVDSPILVNAGLNHADNTRYSQALSSLVRWRDKQWMVQVAVAHDLPSFGHVLLCNGTLLDRMGSSAIASAPALSKWTLADYREVAAYAETLNNGVPAETRIYGTGITSAHAVFTAYGGEMMDYEHGVLRNRFGTLATSMAYDTLVSLATAPETLHAPADVLLELYADERIVFLWVDSALVYHNRALFTNLSASFILPLPSMDADTASRSILSAVRGYSFPAANTETEKSVAVMNALALRLNTDYVATFLSQTGLSSSNASTIHAFVLPTLTFPVSMFYEEAQQLFTQKVGERLFSGTAQTVPSLYGVAEDMDWLIQRFSMQHE